MENIVGTVYLLHFDPPYKHARHYIGWTSLPVDDRLLRHMQQGKNPRGSKLVYHAVANGCTVTIAKTWENVTREFERKLKNKKCAPRFCLICKEEHTHD